MEERRPREATHHYHPPPPTRKTKQDDTQGTASGRSAGWDQRDDARTKDDSEHQAHGDLKDGDGNTKRTKDMDDTKDNG